MYIIFMRNKLTSFLILFCIITPFKIVALFLDEIIKHISWNFQDWLKFINYVKNIFNIFFYYPSFNIILTDFFKTIVLILVEFLSVQNQDSLKLINHSILTPWVEIFGHLFFFFKELETFSNIGTNILNASTYISIIFLLSHSMDIRIIFI